MYFSMRVPAFIMRQLMAWIYLVALTMFVMYVVWWYCYG